MTCTFVRYPMEVHVTHSVIASQEKFRIFSRDRGERRGRPWERTLPACSAFLTPRTQDACAPKRTHKSLFQKAKDFRVRSVGDTEYTGMHGGCLCEISVPSVSPW